jgi:membrane protein
LKDFAVRTYREFGRDGGSRLAAALAYYALFAIAPALIVAVAIAGAFLDQAAVSEVLKESVAQLLGQDLTNLLVDLAQSRTANSYYDTAWVAVAVLFVTSALALNQVQVAFNRMWLLDLKSGAPIWQVVRARLAQAAIALLPAALLVAATAANSIAAAIAARPYLGQLATFMETIGSPLMVTGAAAIAFTIVFKYLPDAYVPWRPAVISAAITALAWFVGTYVFGLYVGRTATASVYGAAGSVFVLLIWLNYSARIALLGCKISMMLTERSGTGIKSRPYATRVCYQALVEPDSEAARPPQSPGRVND